MKTKTQIDLSAWCEPQSLRYSIGEPWVKDGYRYATDAMKAIRLPTDEPDTPPRERRFPDAAVIFDDAKFGGIKAWHQLSQAQPNKDDCGYCLTCDETGVVNSKGCPYCEGYGCHKCNQKGFTGGVKCPACDGTGKHPGPYSFSFGKIRVRYDHVEAIQKLPHVWFAERRKAMQVLLKFDGGEAIVMGLSDGVRCMK